MTARPSKVFPSVFLVLSNIEQNSLYLVCTIDLISGVDMEDRASSHQWRLEVYNPYRRNDWKTLWGFDDDTHAAYHVLILELNLINAPVQLRIVRNSLDVT